MNKEFEPLFKPFNIGNLKVKNRIVMTSMGGTSIFGWMEPNHFDKEAANFLLERAKENVGLILPGIAPIRDILLNKWLYRGKGKFKKLKKFVDEFHKTGCKLFIQLTAGFGRSLAINDLMIKAIKHKWLGFILKPILNVDWLTMSASRTPNRWDNTCFSRPMTKKEINKIVEAFAKTSKYLKDAGVDGVEVHAVHEGYLLDQFTLKYCNMRTDEYGGSFENRYRFPVEIVKAIKNECGKDFPVSLRFSVISKTKDFQSGAMPGEKYHEVGRDLLEAKKAAKLFEESGYDMLNCDNGTYDAWYWAHPGPYMPHNCNLEDVKEIKKIVNIPIVCAGKMTPIVAANAIKNNEIDAMGVARQFLVDKEWVTKLINDKIDEIHPCIHCHNGCFNMAHYNGVGNDQTLSDNAGMARCALNPETMQSKKYKIIKTKTPKKVAIIGGGIGGMEVARVLAKRGHKPTIFEKSNKLGGVFNAAAAPDFKTNDKWLLNWYQKEMVSNKIEVKLNTEISNINELNDFDDVIIATGSSPKKAPIPGFDKTIEAIDYLNNNKQVGKNVVIIGGGLSGCEIALDLFNKGKNPIIIESKNDLIAVRGVCLANSSYLRDFFKLHNVEIHLNSIVKQINDGSICIHDNLQNKDIEIKCDDIISCIGYLPNPLVDKKSKLVGDCYKVGNLKTVIWRAWDIAMKI